MKVTIETKKTGHLLRWVCPQTGKRVSISVNEASDGRNPTKLKDRIENDIKHCEYDPTLVKYRPKTIGKNKTELTTVELFDRFTQHQIKEKRLSKSSIDTRYKYTQRMLEKHLNIPAYQMDRRRVESFLDVCWDTLKPNTAKARIWLLESAFDWGRGRYELPIENPWKGVAKRFRSLPVTNHAAFSADEVKRIIQGFRDSRYYAHYADYVVFRFGTGTRPGEASALKWKHLSPDFRSVWIGESYSRGHTGSTKTKRSRTVSMPDTIAAMLSARKESLAPKSDGELVFTTPTGLPINETEIPIIDGYDRLEYTVDGGRKTQIPSQKLLEELIRFPKIDRRYPDPSDPFNVDYFRFRDRDEDLDNQLFLQSRSNWIVNEIYKSRYHPTEFESKLRLCCDKHSVCFQSVYYRLKLMQYCRNIMPGVYPDTSSKNPALIRAFERMKDLSEDGYSKRYDLTKPLVNNDAVAAYQKRSVMFYETLRRRFSEYNEAFQYMDWLISIPFIYEEMRDVTYEDMWIQNKRNEKIRYRKYPRDKQPVNKKSTNNTDSQIADAKKILTQCVFCNRFQLQKPNPRGLKRYCADRSECKKQDRAWRGSLPSRNISLENDDVSPSSF